MFDQDDVVDFEPVCISEIVTERGVVVVKAPSQPCYSQVPEDGPCSLPLYSCEMRVYGGTIEKLNAEFPFETEDWEIEFRGGSRSCFLPWAFEADGPVRLTFFSEEDVPVIETIGERFALQIVDLVGNFEMRDVT